MGLRRGGQKRQTLRSTPGGAAIRLMSMPPTNYLRSTLAMLMLAVVAWAQRPIGELQSGDATVRGSVILAKTGTRVMSGTQILAEASPAVLKLTRGGEIQICPRSSVTISSSNSGQENLVGLSAGSMEANYQMASSADTVMTPDFRILLAGPGNFHFAFGLYPGGDVCVKSLDGSSASVIVSEMFGEGTRQVKPGEEIVFHAGQVQNASAILGQSCGCPAVAEPLRVATAGGLGFPEQESQRAAAAVAAGERLPEPAPAASAETKPGELAMKVDAPMVFESEDLPPNAASVARSNLAAVQFPILMSVEPPASKPPEKRWYQKVGSVFSRFFHGKRST